MDIGNLPVYSPKKEEPKDRDTSKSTTPKEKDPWDEIGDYDDEEEAQQAKKAAPTTTTTPSATATTNTPSNTPGATVTVKPKKN
ncbi:hypothetical protein K501DRAFT_285270 [Backusella circina FSU 941]|nr:hypothetical protein K501DRAFT_285270 [Backusella circina FSU 941]